jgi:TRAP-type C4-dicarboxylate transport system permease large subunit
LLHPWLWQPSLFGGLIESGAYGIVLLIAMGTGAFLPPLGVGFYIACAIARAPMGESTRAMIPYVAVLLVTFVPWSTLALPRSVGLIQ